MSASLKPISQQVIVITGASSGIGLATAQAAATQGAKLVLVARSRDTLKEIVQRITNSGCEAIHVVADVGQRDQVDAVVDAALKRFGRIDTWVNNAGVGIYGRLDEVKEQDSRRLFDTNFWGVVNGSLAVLAHLKQHGGALINVGSEVSEAVVPLQGMYAASKHAVKGFTDALRVEVEEVDGAPVAITLIQPTAVDTPYPQHARNYMKKEPKLPPPRIEPERVARAILDAASNHRRDVRVGAFARINTFLAKVAPKIADSVTALQVHRQHYDEQPREPRGTLFRAGRSGQIKGSGPVREAQR